MNKDFSQAPRPTFKRALRRISVISVVISMTLVWLLLSTASVFTLKQYAQKNLALTAATMSRSLEAALVFDDSAAAEETLATLGRQGQFSEALVLDNQQNTSPSGVIRTWFGRRNSAGSSANGCFLNQQPSQSGIWGRSSANFG